MTDRIDTNGCDDEIQRIAQQVADCFAQEGYAFIEESDVGGLAVALRSFLAAAGISVAAGAAGAGRPGAAPGEC